MDTTLMPLNSAQFSNSISSIGEWFQPYFNPLLTLGLMFAGITIAVIVVRAIYYWIVDAVRYGFTDKRSEYTKLMDQTKPGDVNYPDW